MPASGQSLASSDFGKLCVVTVTYGRRWHLLREVIAAAQAEGADEIVVIDNAAEEDIPRLVAEEFGNFVEVVRMPRNTGSAGGFKTGVERAMGPDSDYILLLDDDNKLDRGCLAALRAGYCAELASGGVAPDALAVLAFRSHFH